MGTSIGYLAELALDIGGQPNRHVYAKNASDRQSTLILDFTDTTSICGWQPKTSLRHGLA